MLKRIASVLIGLVVCLAVIFLLEALSAMIYPPPSGTNIKDPESVRFMMGHMPDAAFLMVLLAYILGCFSGGMVASFISGRKKPTASIIVGCIVFVSGILNVVSLPGQPVWFIVVSFILYIPFAYIGYLVVRKKAGTVSLQAAAQ